MASNQWAANTCCQLGTSYMWLQKVGPEWHTIVTITQTAPANLMDAKIKLTLPAGTDVRRNDRIVDCMTGLEYTAEQPINIRGHHVFVYIKRTGGQRAL